MRVLLLAGLLAPGLTSCTSCPTPPPLTAEQSERVALALPTGLRVRVEPAGTPERPAQSLDPRTMGVVEDLRRTALFAEVGALDEVADPDLVVVVHDVGLPYHQKPGHNPGAFLLSLVVPFRYQDEGGYHLSVRDVRAEREVEIDTTYDGTHVMWSLAPILNLDPDRRRVADRDLELEHLMLGILGAGLSSGTP